MQGEVFQKGEQYMDNHIFTKLLAHEDSKEVPLSYIIKIFSAIQEIVEEEKEEETMMDMS